MPKPSKKDFQQISKYVWEIQTSFRQDMRVPARIYASEQILEKCLEDDSISQLVNMTALPGIVNYALAMPDAHQGYGFPIGGVAAVKYPDGVISPGGIGFDENCGVRLLYSEFNDTGITAYLEKLADEICRQVPSGVGRGRGKHLPISQIDRILLGGAQELVKLGYGIQEDIEHCEERGKMEHTDPSSVSNQAKMRSRNQVGTLGAGNHFLEIQKVEQIFDEKTAKIFGLSKDRITVMIHSGSRGLGHQTCDDYLKIARHAMPKYGISVSDRDLSCVPFNSPEGRQFFSAMSAASNYAWANRQAITYYIRRAWQIILGKSANLSLVYDVAHNIAKIEEQIINGQKIKLIVHRKGATRAFPKDSPEIPEKYKKIGQPILIPGSMGTGSYVMAGLPKAAETFYSVSHGAGREMSRSQAIKMLKPAQIKKELKAQKIIVKASNRGLVEEAPMVYKNVDNVVDVIAGAGLARKIALLKPLAVVKG